MEPWCEKNKQPRQTMVKTRKCECCGRNIDSLPIGEITCSNEECRVTSTRNVLLCVICGKPFERSLTTIACSEECKKIYVKRVNKEQKIIRALMKKHKSTDSKHICSFCGKNINDLSADEIACKKKKCQAMAKGFYAKCVICGTRFKKTRTIITCSESCKEARAQILKKDRNAKARAKRNAKKQQDCKCIYCDGIIDKNRLGWTSRIYCNKEECKEKMALRIKEQQRKSHREIYARKKRVEDEVTIGIRTKKEIYNTNHEDYFDHLMYLREMKEANKTNGKICEDCGCALRGDFRKRCKGCMTKRHQSAERFDGDYLFDTLVNHPTMAAKAPKARYS